MDFFGIDIFEALESDVKPECGCAMQCVNCEESDSIISATSYLEPSVDNTADHYQSVYSK